MAHSFLLLETTRYLMPLFLEICITNWNIVELYYVTLYSSNYVLGNNLSIQTAIILLSPLCKNAIILNDRRNITKRVMKEENVYHYHKFPVYFHVCINVSVHITFWLEGVIFILCHTITCLKSVVVACVSSSLFVDLYIILSKKKLQSNVTNHARVKIKI